MISANAIPKIFKGKLGVVIVVVFLVILVGLLIHHTTVSNVSNASSTEEVGQETPSPESSPEITKEIEEEIKKEEELEESDKSPPEIFVKLSKEKVKKGDTVDIEVTARDESGVASVVAEVETEGTFNLQLAEGSEYSGIWRASFVIVSDLEKDKKYKIVIKAFDRRGNLAVKTLEYYDPVTKIVIPRADDDMNYQTQDSDCSSNPEYKYYTCSNCDENDIPGWYMLSYDDSSWPTGYAPFGQPAWGECTQALTSAPDDLFVRKWFFIPGTPQGATLRLSYDDGIKCYINENVVINVISEAHGPSYWNRQVTISSSVLKSGQNLLTCWVANGGENSGSGGGWLDLELEVTYEPIYITNVTVETDKQAYDPGDDVNITVTVFSDSTRLSNVPVTIKIYDPDEKIVLDKQAVTDNNGEVKLTYTLPVDAKWGVYVINATAEMENTFSTIKKFGVGPAVDIFDIKTTPQKVKAPANVTITADISNIGSMNLSNLVVETKIIGGSWFDASWNYRVPITITEQSGNVLTDYQVLVTLDTASLISAGKMRSDCGDIRFADSNGNTLSYWIESGCGSANTKIWIKVPEIMANKNTTIYVYYGNPNAESMSNGNDVFLDYEETLYCQGSTASGGCYVTFSLSNEKFAPYQSSGYGVLDWKMAGDFNSGGSYSSSGCSCVSESYERARLCADSTTCSDTHPNCLGCYSTGYQDCTLRSPSGFPKDVSSYIIDKTSVSFATDTTNEVNYNPGCGYYYKFEFHLKAKTRKYVSPEPTTSVGDEETLSSVILASLSKTISSLAVGQTINDFQLGKVDVDCWDVGNYNIVITVKQG